MIIIGGVSVIAIGLIAWKGSALVRATLGWVSIGKGKLIRLVGGKDTPGLVQRV